MVLLGYRVGYVMRGFFTNQDGRGILWWPRVPLIVHPSRPNYPLERCIGVA